LPFAGFFADFFLALAMKLLPSTGGSL